MQSTSVYSLPKLLAGRYMLTAVLRETADTVVYLATQNDLSREVVVESLRPERMATPYKVQFFLETARAQTAMGGKSIASVLEAVYEEETWHIARERIRSKPVDELLAEGEKGSAASFCELMLLLIRSCILHDVQGIATTPFTLQNAHFMGLSFRLDNLAQAGERDPLSSYRDVQNAARDMLPKVDEASPRAADLVVILSNILRIAHWKTTTLLDIYAEFVRLQLLLTRA